MATAVSEMSTLHENYSPKSNEHEDFPPTPPPGPMRLTHHHVPTSSTTMMIPDATFDDSPSKEIVLNFDAENSKTHTLHDDNDSEDGIGYLEESIFDDFFVRSLYLNLTLFSFSILSCYLWFGEVVGNRELATAYIIAAFSIIVLFNASICGLVLAVFGKFAKETPSPKVRCGIMSFYVIGAFFYFVAGCLYASSWNGLGVDNALNLTSFAGIVWTEMFYISAFAVITGMDLWSQFLDRKDIRMFTIFGLYAFCSMLLFFCYLCAARVGIADYTSLTVIGVGHFFGFTVCIVYLVYFALYMLVTEEYVIRLTLDRYKSLIDMVCCVLMAFWIGWTCIAYWSADKVRSQDVVYYFGFGLFLLSMAVMMTFDMALWSIIEKRMFTKYTSDAISDCDEENHDMEEEEQIGKDGVVTVNLK